jgi:Txe/YoeB family toxin of Txe-Axe toxin-antitoxin module
MKNILVTFANQKIADSYSKISRGKFEEKQLYAFISRAIEDLRKNPFCGIRISNKQIPVEYFKKFEISNLWKYNLPNSWRLLYSIKGNEVEIVNMIVEWLDHKNYERRFHY